jgi:hypothetical protein
MVARCYRLKKRFEDDVLQEDFDKRVADFLTGKGPGKIISVNEYMTRDGLGLYVTIWCWEEIESKQ